MPKNPQTNEERRRERREKASGEISAFPKRAFCLQQE